MKHFFIFVVFLSIFLSGASGEEVRSVDSDGDGRPDQWLYSAGSRLVRLEEDLNRDGTVDKRADFFYKDGEKYKVEIDSNMDGKPDGWSFHRAGVRYLIESDTDYDGRADYVIDNDKGLTSVDTDYDGRMDVEESNGYRSFDNDLDGTLESREALGVDLETWLARVRPDYSARLQQYMKNTGYKRKTGQ